MFTSSNNPFCESFTTNTNDQRVCFYGNVHEHTGKKGWLNKGMKDRFVDVNGDDSNEWCITSETTTCKTVGFAIDMSSQQLTSIVTVLEGKHESEVEIINIGGKKIMIIGKGREESVIGTNLLSIDSTTLFSVTSGQLEVEHVGIDHNTERSPSPNVFVVSDGSGSLSLADILISGTRRRSVISASVFEVALRQLKMIDVEVKNIKISQPLFAEPSSAESTAGESFLRDLTIRNVNRTGGDGVVVLKSVGAGETFVVWNMTMEECECVNGDGGGIKVELATSSSKVRVGGSTSQRRVSTKFFKMKCDGYGGEVMLWKCQTMEIPFGDIETEPAEEKIKDR
ncbi:uncharacterized protein MONOS_15581 [Monocercomonoides exilis]|uniref:uncharacterized protein n=1 Tax=Monocercomonoides exilis TaxID=2049356 RepID=UPI0035596EA5|nr:hypothetical protein MONOS_15581 [Monocercomonoides exilis]|eukprot:MONOS_15581.1-p1 / transcript=MONOS_15581.1 / gene=MONOS_15581 / organism=Monocercomonoides_exilis_PA203 / gene_product=unspecified product / transcript_product=unspecified product / location=Mono_scaffold01280:2216-3235(-) / protein_length=340 / sequence_SO=supercontig / SO=protein_coding / is_pseudo=false